MRLFAIGDTHLPSERKKDMHRFGWTDHPEPLRRSWDALVKSNDVIIVAGDISWGTKAEDVATDLRWIDERPGQKIFLRGNHDNWCGDSSAKLKKLFEPYASIVGFIHNSAVTIGPWVIAGSRLWTAPQAPSMPGAGELGDPLAKPEFVEREVRRLQLSIDAAHKHEQASSGQLVRIAATHFPPRYSNGLETVFSKSIEAWKPVVCVYGHLHGEGISAGFVGQGGGVRYVLASCDAAQFQPVLIHEVAD